VVARRERGRTQARHGTLDGAAGEGVRALVRDAGVAAGEQGEPEAVEREVRDHDRGDQRQDQQGFRLGSSRAGLVT